MKINVIKDIHIYKNEDVTKEDESWLLTQPDKPKHQLGMFNYWSEKKRKNISDEAVTSRLILDYDDGPRRCEIEEKFKDFEYMIYNSAGNKTSEGVEKFRVILALKTPITADDLRWWRAQKIFKSYFKGVDESSFAIGRFFYRPSKYDSERVAVKVTINKGEKFDFYGMFTNREGIEMLESVKQKIFMKNVNRKFTEKNEEIFDEWVKKKYPNGTHYPDVCAFCVRAISCRIE